MVRKEIDIDLAKEKFYYKDGGLYWLKTKNGYTGEKAGWITKRGYRMVCINQVHFLEHRVIYSMLSGPIPKGYEIDHIDNDKINNRIENLRVATKSQNNSNIKKPKHNTSGYKGVSFSKNENKWIASISFNRVKKFLGYFPTPELANEAYKTASLKMAGEFSNIG